MDDDQIGGGERPWSSSWGESGAVAGHCGAVLAIQYQMMGEIVRESLGSWVQAGVEMIRGKRSESKSNVLGRSSHFHVSPLPPSSEARGF